MPVTLDLREIQRFEKGRLGPAMRSDKRADLTGARLRDSLAQGAESIGANAFTGRVDGFDVIARRIGRSFAEIVSGDSSYVNREERIGPCLPFQENAVSQLLLRGSKRRLAPDSAAFQAGGDSGNRPCCVN